MPLKDIWDDRFAHLGGLPDHILLDQIARNEAASHAYRKYAVELLVSRKSPKAKHPELQQFVDELEIELDGIQFDFPAPEPGPGPLVASVTTSTLFSNPFSEQPLSEEEAAPDPPPQVEAVNPRVRKTKPPKSKD
jgi:hypothetical protein